MKAYEFCMLLAVIVLALFWVLWNTLKVLVVLKVLGDMS